MPKTSSSSFRIPNAPTFIETGSTLTTLLDAEAIACLAHNLSRVHRRFDAKGFTRDATNGLAPLSILQRGHHLAAAMREHLPPVFEEAVEVMLQSLTPPLPLDTRGLNVFFYLPHSYFVCDFGLDQTGNGGRDPFEISMRANYEITRRFTAEFSIRAFLVRWPERTLKRLTKWLGDPDPRVRRLCSEGTRPRLPWAQRIPAFVKDPSPALPLLEALKDDPELYVRRSVANHLGDIAKDHPALALEICERWLRNASAERKWVIRHALRHPAKKGVRAALQLRKAAK